MRKRACADRALSLPNWNVRVSANDLSARGLAPNSCVPCRIMHHILNATNHCHWGDSPLTCARARVMVRYGIYSAFSQEGVPHRMEATNRLQRSRLALVTLGHFLNDSYGSFFTPILPVLIEKLSLWMMRVGSALEVGLPPAGMDVPDLRPLLGAIVATPSHPRHLTK